MITTTRRAKAAAFALLLAFVGAAHAQYPDRSVRIILPYAAGGGADVLTRTIAQALSERWKQSVVVDNRPGAGATLGTDMVAKASPDGYTVLMTAGTMAVSPAAYPNLPYDVLKDFRPITLVAQTPYVLAVNSARVQARTVPEFVAFSKANPGKLNFGAPGRGTLAHLTYELLRGRTGLDATLVNYKGSNPALLAAVGGEVDFVIDTPAAVMQHVTSGKLYALAVSSKTPTPSAPGTPPLAEAGVPGFDVSVWFGLLAPAGTPDAVIAKLHADTLAVLGTAAVRDRLKANGLDVVTTQPAEFATYLREEVTKWGDVVRNAAVKFD